MATKPITSAGLELVLSHTEKASIISYYIQFSTIIKMQNHNIKTSFVFISVVLESYFNPTSRIIDNFTQKKSPWN